MTNLGLGLILLLAGRAAQGGTFTVGDFALFVSYLDDISFIMFFFGNMVAQHRKMGVSFDRMLALLRRRAAQRAGGAPPGPPARCLPRGAARAARRGTAGPAGGVRPHLPPSWLGPRDRRCQLRRWSAAASP